MWENVSPALFKQIHFEGVLTTPTPRYLKSLSSPFTVDTGISETNRQYLKARVSKLPEREKDVNYLADEVYATKRVEYSAGTFYGYENQNISKTLLCFMVKSVAGKYQDIVCMCLSGFENFSLLFNISLHL